MTGDAPHTLPWFPSFFEPFQPHSPGPPSGTVDAEVSPASQPSRKGDEKRIGVWTWQPDHPAQFPTTGPTLKFPQPSSSSAQSATETRRLLPLLQRPSTLCFPWGTNQAPSVLQVLPKPWPPMVPAHTSWGSSSSPGGLAHTSARNQHQLPPSLASDPQLCQTALQRLQVEDFGACFSGQSMDCAFQTVAWWAWQGAQGQGSQEELAFYTGPEVLYSSGRGALFRFPLSRLPSPSLFRSRSAEVNLYPLMVSTIASSKRERTLPFSLNTPESHSLDFSSIYHNVNNYDSVLLFNA